jgi:hypothetical protein
MIIFMQGKIRFEATSYISSSDSGKKLQYQLVLWNKSAAICRIVECSVLNIKGNKVASVAFRMEDGGVALFCDCASNGYFSSESRTFILTTSPSYAALICFMLWRELRDP